MVIANEFDYRRPDTLGEAIQILTSESGSVRILAGGTDLVAWLRDDAIAPDLVVDIKDVPGLHDLRFDAGTLHIGSLVTFTELIESDQNFTDQSPGRTTEATVLLSIIHFDIAKACSMKL